MVQPAPAYPISSALRCGLNEGRRRKEFACEEAGQRRPWALLNLVSGGQGACKRPQAYLLILDCREKTTTLTFFLQDTVHKFTCASHREHFKP